MEEERDKDAELMLRTQQGDNAAFELLVDSYKQPVANLITRILGDSAEAADLAQKVFIQAYRAAGRYRPTARFSTWLFTIARNLSLNEIRRRKRRPVTSLEESSESSPGEGSFLRDRKGDDPRDSLLKGELGERIAQALGELPSSQRTAMALLLENGLSYEEISRVLGCSLSAVKSLIHRARETLRSRIRPYLEDGSWEEE